jgi:L-ascorbate metabolism protein UlaG (beta-lactamase superfamily)
MRKTPSRTWAGACVLLALAMGCGSGPTSPSSTTPTPTPTPPPITLPAGNSITYMGNAGFLIVAGGRKILIDSLYDGYSGRYVVPSSIRTPLIAGQAPLDGIELVLATHSHADHYSASPVISFLQNNTSATFVGPPDTTAALSSFGSRVVAVDVAEGQRTTVSVGAIQIAALYLSHGVPDDPGDGVLNLGYIITVGGLKLFHTGDIDPGIVNLAYSRRLGVPDENLDFAFVPHHVLETQGPDPLVTEGIRARQLVGQHYQYTTTAVNYTLIQRNYPTAILFRQEGESRAIQ